MKHNLNFLLISFLAFNLLAQEEQITPDKNIGVLKREVLNEGITCPLSQVEDRNFGLTPPGAFNKVLVEKFDTPTPPRMKIPGLYPDYDGRVNKLTGLVGKYIPPESGTPQEIASRFLLLYKQELLLGDFPNNYSEPEIKDEFGDGVTLVSFKQTFNGLKVGGGLVVSINPEQNITRVSISRQIITDLNKVVITPDINNEGTAVNMAANYLKSKLPHLKRYAVWGTEAYVMAKNGVPYTAWFIGGDSDCPSATYTFKINIESSEIEEVSADTASVD